MAESALRGDLQVIASLVPQGASVLDVGCGDGELLAWLAVHRQVYARGIELEQTLVDKAIGRGVAVIQGNINADLSYYPDGAVDLAILSQTLQAMEDPVHVLCELLRIGRRAIVSIPNFGHWKNRLYLGLKGRMPVTRTLTYQWYDTPNIHFCTIADLDELCTQLGITVEKRIVVGHGGQARKGFGLAANLFGEQGIFLLSRPQGGCGEKG